jgi:hypothetical protein
MTVEKTLRVFEISAIVPAIALIHRFASSSPISPASILRTALHSGKNAQMKWLFLLAIAMNCSPAVVVHADDYRLQVETIEHKFTGEEDKNASKEEVVNSIEVLTRPGEKFHTKVVIGTRTIVVSGKLKQDKDGNFVVQIRHFESVESGHFVNIVAGVGQPLLDISAVSTQVGVVVDTPFDVGGMTTAMAEAGKEAITRKRRIVLTLTKVDVQDET